MARIRLLSVVIGGCWCLVGCMTPREAPHAEPDPADLPLSEPVMVTEVIAFKAPARVVSLRGTCYLVRNDTPSKAMRAGEVLLDGDVIDLDDDCEIKIMASANRDVLLRRRDGRFFKIEMK